ncbi:seryl-tRNA synthetase protein [Rutstroemia sp. NJR-2017a WRK4]|nr:seryl-tRNA synthetase protein [Rutstroemia sp. NJR-2017a WRK4]
MVSQVEPAQSLALRGPSSVVSRVSASRHRRHGRSHAGGSSYIPQNDFPVFTHTGDVEIIIKAGSKTNRYLLHRLILTNCSGFFEASTSQAWSRATTTTSEVGGELARIGEDSGSEAGGRKEPRRRWRYELDSGTSNDDIPMLVQKPESSPSTTVSLFGAGDHRPPPVRNKPPSSNPSFFRSVANLSISSHSTTPAPPQITQEDQDLLNDYDNLFRIFYNHPPHLDSIDIAVAYIQCKSLLTLADLYDALAVVGPRIDHHLLQFHSRLWKQIAKYPSSYLKLGYLSQSKTIFQEALIHVVGAWPAGERHIRNQLPDSVVETIEDKVEDLRDLVRGIEGQLFRLTLLNARGERVTPSNSYADWLVVSLFRQWLAENTSPPQTPPPTRSPRQHARSSSLTVQNPPSAPPPLSQNQQMGRTYKLLGSSSNQAYLNHEECKKFLKLTPELYSRDGIRRFEKRLDEMKAMAREVVQPLMRSYLEGDASGVSFLVCTRVDDRDFSWL